VSSLAGSTQVFTVTATDSTGISGMLTINFTTGNACG
jgi:hypothetical protein